MADYFREPVIQEIDASEWQGRAGTEIWVQALDDTLVTRVHVTISDQNGAVLEEGNAQPADGLWWTYTATTTVPMVQTFRVLKEKEVKQFGDAPHSDETSRERSEWRHAIK